MAISVNVPTPLRKLTDNQAEVEIDAASVEELIDGLENAHAGIKEKLLDESGDIRRYVNIFVNDEDIRFLEGKETELRDGDNVSIVPSIAGGRRQVDSLGTVRTAPPVAVPEGDDPDGKARIGNHALQQSPPELS